ncbi:Mor transcription activator family protein [Clostridium sp. CCUG 7971]|uniref:Mor transcription activator family protein n=1 Tax=Clostridium sp. CCUG 7971 TaxID=2811414 RepID=UPI001ABBB972|nr:Mor transcription activator family protein [Clostridium sp. CCUG 7971]MBO3444585.1 DNA-binding protein [Clostridium sp. CCUG 7971]
MLKYLSKEDLPESVLDIVDTIGIDAFKDLVRLLGGSSLYIPSESSLAKPLRNKRIRESFNGDYKAISRKFGISEVQVRNIINFK